MISSMADRSGRSGGDRLNGVGAGDLRRTSPASKDKKEIPVHVYYGLVVLVIVFFALIRFRLRDMPLERDEGEYAYLGQLMLQGIPPYQLASNMKLPGTYAAYSVILAVFGQTPAAVHEGVILVNAATIVLVYFLTARLFGPAAGVVASASYGLLSSRPAMLGLAGHATHFVVLAAMGGSLLLLRAIVSKGSWLFFASGTLMGLAFLMKQPGIFFSLFGLFYLLITERKSKSNWRVLSGRVGYFALGAALPFLLTCLILFKAGVFRNFWFWTFSYASKYATTIPIRSGVRLFWRHFPQQVVGTSIFIWLIAAAGFSALLWNAKARSHACFVAGFLLFSFLAVCPGFHFRPHYFIVMLPAVSLLAGVAGASAMDLFPCNSVLRFGSVFVFVAAWGYPIVQQAYFFFKEDPTVACRSIYGGNPFPEALRIADYLKRHTTETSRIAVLGSEPEIYFYAHRHSATSYIYTYGPTENQPYALQMQKEIISEIEASRPEYLIYIDMADSWDVRPDNHLLIFSWAHRYLQDHYELTGIADVLPQTQYRWGEDAKAYRPRSRDTIQVFKRKES
jgi:dolichyl-phosphate-mannose-protein mannosyltransferase